MKFYLLAAFLFVAMMAVMAVPVKEHLVDSVSNAIEGRAERHARTSCTIKGGGDWLCTLACKTKGRSSGYCKGDYCYCR